MVKKIILTTLAIILAGAVGVGLYDAYQGRSTFEMPNVQAMAAGTGLIGQGQGQGGGHGQGQGQQGQGGNPTGGEPIAHEWLTLTGTVVGLETQGLRVETGERGEVLLNLGRPGFAEQQNVTFAPGQAVTIQGFDSPQGQFVAGVITNDTTSATLMLRDPNGRPLWAGRGQGQGGGGRGQGQGGGQGQGQGQ